MQANPSQQPLQLDAVQAVVEHTPAWQAPPMPHEVQAAPPSPHWLLLWLPGSTQTTLLQQPAQVLALHTPPSGTQKPAWQMPPALHDVQKVPPAPQCSESVPEKQPPSASQQPPGHNAGQLDLTKQLP
jgi:hypothetical protein